MTERTGQPLTFTRRGFVGTTAAAAVSSSTLLSMGNAFASEPKAGGTLRYAVGHGSTTDSLEPGQYGNEFTIGMAHTLNNHLAEFGPDGDLIGEVAESWDASPDVKVWAFKIRKGIEFHNGKTLTPDDVVASINYHRGEDTKSNAKPLLSSIVDIKTDGSNVIFELDSGNADFPYLVANFQVVIVPSSDGVVANALDGVGCGPYTLEHFEPGVSASFSKNKNYWKDGRGHFDSVEVTSVVDSTARINALISGAVDVIDRVDPKTVDLVNKSQSVAVVSVSGNQHYTFPMLTNVEPFNDANVRKALKWAAPREDMVKKILNGHGTVGNDHPIGTNVKFAANDLPQIANDPDKAKFYAKKSGIDKIAVALSAADAAFGGAVDAAVLYAEAASKAGIEINVLREPNDGYWGNVWQNKPWCACYWGGAPTVDAMLSLAYLPGVPWNDTNWDNQRFVDLVTMGRSELDDLKRSEIYREAQQLVAEDGGTVVPMFANHLLAKSDRVSHGVISGNLPMDGQKFAERWWFS